MQVNILNCEQMPELRLHSSGDDDDDDDDDSVCSAFIVGAILLDAGLVPSGRTKPLVAVAASDSAQRQHACDFMALSWKLDGSNEALKRINDEQ